MPAPAVEGLRCRACGAPIEARDLDTVRSMARCHFCGSLFAFAGAEAAEKERAPVALPRGLCVQALPEGVRIVSRWNRPRAMGIGVAVVLAAVLLRACDSRLGPELPRGLVLGPWILVLAVVAYAGLCLALNRSVLTLAGGRIRVWHGPLPAPGRRSLERAAVEQFFGRCEKEEEQGYAVRALLSSGRATTLLKGLSQHVALFVEQELEARLGVRDQAVEGELGGPKASGHVSRAQGEGRAPTTEEPPAAAPAPAVVDDRCRNCGATRREKDVDAGRGVATCAICGAVALGGGRAAEAHDWRRRALVALPDGVSVDDAGGRLRIVSLWRSAPLAPAKALALILMAVVVVANPASAELYVGLARGESHGPSPAILALVLSPFLALVLGMLYGGMALLASRTVIEVSGGRLRRRELPLPFAGPRDLAAAEVHQVFTSAQRQLEGKRMVNHYSLSLVTAEGWRVDLMSVPIDTPEPWLFIERQIERWLGIEDRAVPEARPKLPERIAIVERGDTFRVTRKYSLAAGIGLGIFALVLTGMDLAMHDSLARHFSSLGALIGAAPVGLLALLCAYGSLCGFVNRSVLEFAGGRLRRWSEPIWTPGARAWNTADVAEVFSRHLQATDEKGTTTHTYLIGLRRNDGKEVLLLADMESEAAAEWVARRLQRRIHPAA